MSALPSMPAVVVSSTAAVPADTYDLLAVLRLTLSSPAGTVAGTQYRIDTTNISSATGNLSPLATDKVTYSGDLAIEVGSFPAVARAAGALMAAIPALAVVKKIQGELAGPTAQLAALQSQLTADQAQLKAAKDPSLIAKLNGAIAVLQGEIASTQATITTLNAALATATAKLQ